MKELRTAADVFRFAITREEEAAAIYADLAEKATDSGLRALWLDLRRDELDHKRHLEALASQAAAGSPPASVRMPADLGLSDPVPDAPLTAAADLQDVLLQAARKEARAAALYSGLAASASDAATKSLLERMAAEELGHKLRLETAYERHFLREN